MDYLPVDEIIDRINEMKGDLYETIERYIDPFEGRLSVEAYDRVQRADRRHLRFQKLIEHLINQLQPEDRVNRDLLWAKQDYEEAFNELEEGIQRGVQNAGRRRMRKTRKSKKSQKRKTRSKKV